MSRHVIFNADDFGASRGINCGIIAAHARGVVTSTSLMVYGRAAREAAAMSQDYPDLAIGLHWDVFGEDERRFDLYNRQLVRDEFHRQLDEFHRLMDRAPTHVDSHRHAHREAGLLPLFEELVAPLGVPLRHNGPVAYVGGFYAQWEWKVSDLHHVSVLFLRQLLAEEATAPWTEFACHPGYASDDFRSIYWREREVELRTLTDPRIRMTIKELGLALASFADWARQPEAA